jgi:ribonucleoside-diphosphate reductase alpha chain
MASDSELVGVCRGKGYHVEYVRNFDGTEDRGTVVVSFPCRFPDGTKLANDMTAINQLDVVKRLQAEWSDNAVSVTIYYRKEELPEIKEWLANNYFNVKSVSFLLHNEHGFDQAPFEEITKEAYEKAKSSVEPIDSINQLNFGDIDIADCEGGACPVR